MTLYMYTNSILSVGGYIFYIVIDILNKWSLNTSVPNILYSKTYLATDAFYQPRKTLCSPRLTHVSLVLPRVRKLYCHPQRSHHLYKMCQQNIIFDKADNILNPELYVKSKIHTRDDPK